MLFIYLFFVRYSPFSKKTVMIESEFVIENEIETKKKRKRNEKKQKRNEKKQKRKINKKERKNR